MRQHPLAIVAPPAPRYPTSRNSTYQQELQQAVAHFIVLLKDGFVAGDFDWRTALAICKREGYELYRQGVPPWEMIQTLISWDTIRLIDQAAGRSMKYVGSTSHAIEALRHGYESGIGRQLRES